MILIEQIINNFFLELAVHQKVIFIRFTYNLIHRQMDLNLALSDVKY